MQRRSDVILRIGFILFVVLSFVPLPILAQESEQLSYEDASEILDQADVRGFIWGLPPSIIKAEEKSIFVEEADDGTLFYVDNIRGIKSSITYEFEYNKLNRVSIFSENEYPKPQDRIDDFVKIKRDLDQRFGVPTEENFDWKKDTDKKYPDQWGWTVYRGDLDITITWKNVDTLVTAYLGSPEPYDPVLFVTYEDRKAKQAKADKKNKKSLKIMP